MEDREGTNVTFALLFKWNKLQWKRQQVIKVLFIPGEYEKIKFCFPVFNDYSDNGYIRT